MVQLNDDSSFQYELTRCLGLARFNGCDTTEVLEIVNNIKPGDFESYYEVFFALAQRVEAAAGVYLPNDAPITKDLSSATRIGARDRLFAAASYYRNADFYLHGNQDDPRIDSLWVRQTTCFNRALALLGNGTRHTLKGDGFEVPIIYYEAPNTPGGVQGSRKPTLIAGNGFDGSQEETLHVFGFAALERGWNVITYEGPGQPTVRRSDPAHNKFRGWIPNWEAAVRPVVDFAIAQPGVDASKLMLSGYSMGGMLCVRAAAFEPRLAAIVAIDGVYSLPATQDNLGLDPAVTELWSSGRRAEFDDRVNAMIGDSTTPIGLRWFFTQGMWSFDVRSPSEMFDKMAEQVLHKQVVQRVKVPVFVGNAQADMFFKGQPEWVAETLGEKAHMRLFTTEEGAGLHCQVGASELLNGEIFAWAEDALGLKGRK